MSDGFPDACGVPRDVVHCQLCTFLLPCNSRVRQAMSLRASL